MKKTRKIIAVMTAAIMSAVLLAGCGGNSAYRGTYHAVVEEMFGVKMFGDDLENLEIELKSGGRGELTTDEGGGSLKWSSEENIITLDIEGEKITAEAEGDALIIDDLLGTGMSVILARVGSEADNHELYINDDDTTLANLEDLDLDTLQGIIDEADETIEALDGEETSAE